MVTNILNEFIEKFRTNTKGLFIVAAVVFGLLLSAYGVYKLYKDDDMVVLYHELDKGDVAAISQKLSEYGVAHDIVSNDQSGKVIKVPKRDVYKARAQLAKDGLPCADVKGYEIFDTGESIGTTNFMQNIKNVRALQGELVRTIQSFDRVLKARVHLAIPQKELFSQEQKKATASVMLSLAKNASLSPIEVKAISHLVAKSVGDLQEKDVTIVDTAGNILQSGNDEDTLLIGSSAQRSTDYEKRLRAKIEALLVKVVGRDNCDVRVSVDMDFDRIVTSSEEYDPDKTAVRSSHVKEEQERTPVGDNDGGDVSVAENMPDNVNDSASGTQYSTVERREDVVNYEISKTTKNIIGEVGTIKRISVSVLVNDLYDKTSNTFSPRSQEDIDKIEELVKSAVGYKESREDNVRVIHMPFFKEDYNNESEEKSISAWWKERNVVLFVGILSLLIAFLASVFWVIKPWLIKITSSAQYQDLQHINVKNVVDNVQLGDERHIRNPKDEALKDALTTDKERFLSTIKRWLQE
ncbi:flagellar basal-body MS-ring/collar protein FliF [Candidatus Sneabacter namystus]|uniref:Flagellar M-ring protein n=1 Tax=Candidatus Sneabacter namystus TaxID=2601646 RepID=A0A5C0UL96_9RICK|nr:flagellar basal-body MS-ring/collar protein FliF [Candidatus Sneabacter namystus]QEK39634.1 flagellar M-ring protein FliF [Candidatus Sneabacter namystus]